MKKLLCNAIANAPDQIVSSQSPSRITAERLVQEAESVKDLLWVLMMRYNSAEEPQATIYDRVNKLRLRAIQRYNRRKVISDIEMYRSWGYTADQVPENIAHYNKIVAVLQEVENVP